MRLEAIATQQDENLPTSTNILLQYHVSDHIILNNMYTPQFTQPH
jgi:hypothetical protein